MSQRSQGEAPKRAAPGDILLVIHDFHARSPDELSLRKGDRIELLEKDDDFGDGWYLGRLLASGVSGLFPEVYTTVAPRPSNAPPPYTRFGATGEDELKPVASDQLPLEPSSAPAQTTVTPGLTVSSDVSPNPQSAQSYAQSYQDEISPRTQDFSNGGGEGSVTPTSPHPSHVSETESARVAPLNTAQSPQRVASVPNATYASQPMSAPLPQQRSISMVMQNNHHSREDSPVIHETLNVIDEHITDMSTPRSSMLQRATGHDSGSEYSTNLDPRASYVHGDESDEDERAAFSEEEVSKWVPEQVARYLESVGVDRKHCDVFREQEISGDILLNLDQASIFMKEFDLGVVGRRLRTWHKIRMFQEEVRSNRDMNSRAGDFYDEPFSAGSQGSGAKLPKIPSLVNRSATNATAPVGGHRRQGSPFNLNRPASHVDRIDTNTSILKQTPTESPSSVRDGQSSLQDSRQGSRRHSSIDFKPARSSLVPSALDTTTPPSTGVPHRKQPSLDRDWSLANATAAVKPSETLSPDTSKLGSTTPRSENQLSIDDDKAEELDRGYMSGGELDSKKLRNVLRKRDGGSSTGHSRQSSYKDESGNLSVSKRHSRFSSAGSIREAFQTMTGRARAQSAKESSPIVGTTTKEVGPPMVTRLDYPPKADASTVGSSLTKTSSEATQSTEKTPIISPSLVSPATGDSKTSSPRTSTATSGKAISVESNDSSSKKGGRSAKTPVRPKHKTATSAYTRGLRKVSPKEALQDCDYSGWMKKKSPGLLAIWRPRLFVLHGRRLAYYYSEDDTEEKGLIDISSHRVLPAENEFLAGVHATATRAAAIPTSPPNATIETMNDAEVARQWDKPEPSSPKSPKNVLGEGSMFIFKLVPPRVGLSKAVQFTKPAVHYFATDNVKQGRLWMAALMKATIDRDDSKPVTSTYTQKTISLAKAKLMRQRPPALMGADEEAAKQELERLENEKEKERERTSKPIHTDTIHEHVNGAETEESAAAAAETPAATTEPTKAADAARPAEPTGLNIEGVDFKPENLVPDTPGSGPKAPASPDRPSLRLVRSTSSNLKVDEKKFEPAPSENSAAATQPQAESQETAAAS